MGNTCYFGRVGFLGLCITCMKEKSASQRERVCVIALLSSVVFVSGVDIPVYGMLCILKATSPSD